MGRFFGVLFPFFIIIQLTACSTAPSITTPPTAQLQNDWQQLQQKLLAFNDWQLLGKIGFRTPEKAGSAHLNWQQQQQHLNIHLSGPFGQGTMQLSGTTEQMTIKIADQGEFQTDQPQQLLQQQIGWPIPVAALLHWVRGLPLPGQQASFELDHKGRLSTLQQSNWQLDYQSYHQSGALWLPKKIRLQRDQIKLTLVIKQWKNNHREADT